MHTYIHTYIGNVLAIIIAVLIAYLPYSSSSTLEAYKVRCVATIKLMHPDAFYSMLSIGFKLLLCMNKLV